MELCFAALWILQYNDVISVAVYLFLYDVNENDHCCNSPTPVGDLYSYLFQNIGAAEKEWPVDYGCFLIHPIGQPWNTG